MAEKEKELRKMNRTELIEIIYALQQDEQTLRKENEQLRAQLDNKLIQIDSAGSIAEASLSLNHIFEDAQKAADQYLLSLRSAQAQSKKIVAQAQEKADRIVTQAEAESAKAKRRTEESQNRYNALTGDLRRIENIFQEIHAVLGTVPSAEENKEA